MSGQETQSDATLLVSALFCVVPRLSSESRVWVFKETWKQDSEDLAYLKSLKVFTYYKKKKTKTLQTFRLV